MLLLEQVLDRREVMVRSNHYNEPLHRTFDPVGAELLHVVLVDGLNAVNLADERSGGLCYHLPLSLLLLDDVDLVEALHRLPLCQQLVFDLLEVPLLKVLVHALLLRHNHVL